MMNGSFTLEGFVPDVDATVVTRILEAGGHIVGKSVCENLCLSAASFSAATGPVVNPHNNTRVAGGSSSGSAALVRKYYLLCNFIYSYYNKHCWTEALSLKRRPKGSMGEGSVFHAC